MTSTPSPDPRRSTSLDTFDFLELLTLLSTQRRTGVLHVYRERDQFDAWLQGGRVRHLGLGERGGVAALTGLLADPRGRFHFDEGLIHPAPNMDASVDEVALDALNELPLPDVAFRGPARIVTPERLAELRWTLREQNILRQIEAQQPVGDLLPDPEARLLLAKLSRLGMIVPRKSRVARLAVVATRQVQGVVVVDETIFQRWKAAIVRHPQNVVIRTDEGQRHTLPVRSGAGLGNQLLVPPELLSRTGLRAGMSVLVKPL